MQELDKAYRYLNRAAVKARVYSEAIGKPYGSDLSHLAYTFEGAVRALRAELIKTAIRHYASIYMPNSEPPRDLDEDLAKKMGEVQFREAVIVRWFEKATKDKEKLSKESLEHLRTLAGRLLPYKTGEDGWSRGKPMEVDQFVKGKNIRLRCSTWMPGVNYKGYVSSYRSFDAILALERLIDVAHYGSDPATAVATVGITSHLNNHAEPDIFYMKNPPCRHPSVHGFQFFKNGSFVVKFRTAEQARKVGALLIDADLVDESEGRFASIKLTS